jgi:acyl dehydratase
MTRWASVAELTGNVGRSLGTSAWLPVDQARIDAFGTCTDDTQWIHSDPARAAHGPFRTTIAHGYLTVSLLSALTRELLDVGGVAMVVNYGLDRVRFTAPVPSGSRVRARATLADATYPAGGGVQVTLDVTVEIEGHSRPACVARPIYRLYA